MQMAVSLFVIISDIKTFGWLLSIFGSDFVEGPASAVKQAGNVSSK